MIDSLKTYIIDILSILVPGGLLIAVLAQFSDVTNTFLEFFPRNDEKWINAVVWIGTVYIGSSRVARWFGLNVLSMHFTGALLLRKIKH